MYGFIEGASTQYSNTGLYQPRSFIISHAATVFKSAPHPEDVQWSNLCLSNSTQCKTSQVLRIVSTGKAIAASPSIFDQNYLDNVTSYGYSYISDIWTGTNSYYRPTANGGKGNTLNLSVGVTSPMTATYTYTGSVQTDNTFKFTSSDGGPDVVFPAPTTSATPVPPGTTSYNIFSAQEFFTTGPAAGGTANDAVSKLVQEAIIAGLVPTTDQLSLSYLTSKQPVFYTINPNLSFQGQKTGPWYDLYSQALHSLGSIYTFGFDEPLWPQTLIGGPFEDSSTYIGITIGNVK